MADSAEKIITPSPDPTVLTREAAASAKDAADLVDDLRASSVQRELRLRQEQRDIKDDNLKQNLEASTKTLQEQILLIRGDERDLTAARLDLLREMVAGIRREIIIYETHRLELKGDSEKTLSTATIAAEKAVQAALAAAEKARDQQTIASQLATTKAEEASKEQMKQQGETFTLAISSLTTGLSDVKGLLGELRAEKRGGMEQNTEHRDKSANWGMWIGVGVAAFVGFNGLILTVLGIGVTFMLTRN